MSTISKRTSLSSILKTYSPKEREKTKNVIMNKVRFDVPSKKPIKVIIENCMETKNYNKINEYIMYLKDAVLDDRDYIRIMLEAKEAIDLLGPDFSILVEILLTIKWLDRGSSAVEEFISFFIELIVAHNRYIKFGVLQLVSCWIPSEKDSLVWCNGKLEESFKCRCEVVHKILCKILESVPISHDTIIETIEMKFPYYKIQSYLVNAYVSNILWFTHFKPIFLRHIIFLLFQKTLILDVNAPREEIEDAEEEAELIIENLDASQQVFYEDMENGMRHPVAETLDACLEQIFLFLKEQISINSTQIFKILLEAFNETLLPAFNTHHVQFIMFYVCSLKTSLAEKFLKNLWDRAINSNVSPTLRQTSIGYIASFLARSKYSTLATLQDYLYEMCSWLHKYIERSDSMRSNNSIKAHKVFYSMCQAVFYIIAFRSRDLTETKKGLMYLQSLQLTAIVTCNLNPLRVCLPTVATAFAGVTRTYELVYCYAILERNARKKLATVYANDSFTSVECLETFFPFDPFLLKKSGKYIEKLYIEYRASEGEEESESNELSSHRKRMGSENIAEDIDDFIVEKRTKINDITSNNDKDF